MTWTQYFDFLGKTAIVVGVGSVFFAIFSLFYLYWAITGRWLMFEWLHDIVKKWNKHTEEGPTIIKLNS